MNKIIYLTGRKFTRLYVIEIVPKHKKRGIHWKCICDCGNERIVKGSSLKSSRTKSCGCYIKELKPITTRKHGLYKSAEYKAWLGIKDRCNNNNHKSYHNYGGRGIKIFPIWDESFIEFYNYIGPRPSNKHSVDRYPDNNGNYKPGNVRWATFKEQQRNRSDNHWLEHNGIRMILVEWAEKLDIPYQVLQRQLKKKEFSEIVEYYTIKNERYNVNNR